MDCGIVSGLWANNEDHSPSKDNEFQIFKLLQHQLMENNALYCDQSQEIQPRLATVLLSFINESIFNTEHNKSGNQREMLETFLNQLVVYGKVAEEDLNRKNKMELSLPSMCLTGKDINHNQVLQTEFSSLEVKEALSPIEKDESWDLFLRCQRQCSNLIDSLKFQLKQEEIDSLRLYSAEMMKCLRRHRALEYASLATPQGEDTQTNQDLNRIFRDTYALCTTESSNTVITAKLRFLNNTLKEVGWSFEKQPPCCLKINNGKQKEKATKEFELHVRVYGVSDFQLTEPPKVSLISEKKFEQLEKEELLPLLEHNVDDGGLVKLKVAIKNYKRCKERSNYTDFEHFNRIIITLNLKTYGNLEIKCLSLPFTVITGSNQRWPYTGAVDWYCWIQKDLYSKPFKCPNEMSINQVLSMLQAKLKHIDPELCFNERNIVALQTMLTSLKKSENKSEKIDMYTLLQQKMPMQARSTSGQHKFSFYTWLVAAFNTLSLYKCYVKEGVLWSFLSFSESKSLLEGKPTGTTIARISNNSIEKEDSKTPYALITVHTQQQNSVITNSEKVSEVKDLYTHLLRLKDKEETPLIQHMLTSKSDNYIPLSDLKTFSTDKSDITSNDYLTKRVKMPGAIICFNDDEQSNTTDATDLNREQATAEKVRLPEQATAVGVSLPDQATPDVGRLPEDLLDLDPMRMDLDADFPSYMGAISEEGIAQNRDPMWPPLNQDSNLYQPENFTYFNDYIMKDA
ncbi:uncharacterized protein LOC131944005 [Physella acuta]|uniref:uncharacterized protein LOC131944005 n=1 Tax=Physella acuta TaxID=109671 RepID=UPI0027DE9100|nr:uncharacterized protein LOC131944005 [Physella acuta]